MIIKKYIRLSSALITILAGCQTSDSPDNLSPFSNDMAGNQGKASNYSIPASANAEQLVDLALSHHPSLKAAQHKITRLQAKVAQERALPDPKARVSMGKLAETAAGQIDSVAGIEQQIPFPGKRRAKAMAAQKETDAAQAELENLKLRIAERVRFTYWDYYLAHQNQRISLENKEILQTVQEIVQARVKANQGTQADLLRIATEMSKIEQQLITARQQINSYKARLNALLNRTARSTLPYPKRSSTPSSSSLNKLIAKAESSHPSIKAGQARVAAFEHYLDKARLDAYPDFLIGAQHAWVDDSGLSPVANGDDQTMFTLGFTLPIWQKPRRAKIREANAGIAEMQAGLASSRAELRQRVEDAWFRAEASRKMITLFDQRLIPDARQAHELSLQSYQAGEQTFVDILDTWRLLLTLQLQQEGNRASLGKAYASLKSAAAIH